MPRLQQEFLPAKSPAIWSRRTLKTFLKNVAGYLALPPNLNVWQWAALNIFLSSDVSSDPGFYDPERIPYQKRMQEWATDQRVNDVIVCTAAQLIKTTAINNIVGYFIAAAPTPILVIYPTIDDSKDWIANKFMPMVRNSAALKKLIPDTNLRTAGQTGQEKHYPGGRLKAIGANSPSSLRGRSFRVVIQDDLDGFKDTSEGDPSALGDKRAENQSRALRLKFSTPTLEGSSRIWKWLEQSTFDQLYCPCPKCDHPQTLVWEQMTWEEGKPETARYKCVSASCGHPWDDRERFQAVLEGCRRDLWVSKNPNSRIKGMHMNGLYRLMGEKNSMSGFFEEWVRGYLTAKANGEKAYQVWVNTFLALCYKSASTTIDADPLWRRRENYKPLVSLPDQVLVVLAAVDVQGNRLEVEVKGFGLGQESWGIEYREFAGDPSEKHVWEKLDVFLQGTYTHPIRGKIRIAQCLIDAGGSKQSEVYIFTESRNGRGIYAIRGARDLNAPLLSPLRKAGYNQVPFYFVGTQAIKDTLFSRLMMKEPGPGYMHFPVSDDYDKDYFKKLTAEKKVLQTKGQNKNKLMWIAPEGARNEPWDINVYLLAALEAGQFTERELKRIWRDNEKRRIEMGLPAPPPSTVMNLDALKGAAMNTTIEKVPEDQRTDLGKPPNPNLAQNAPISSPVEPKPKPAPWKVVGKGRSNFGGFPGSFSPWGQ